ncbi:hypothetical protein GCM10023194_80870 [Planotetraspora phitsanulokensis]
MRQEVSGDTKKPISDEEVGSGRADGFRGVSGALSGGFRVVSVVLHSGGVGVYPGQGLAWVRVVGQQRGLGLGLELVEGLVGHLRLLRVRWR